MTKEGWRQFVLGALDDPEKMDLLVELLAEQDQAQALLRAKGYGWTGMPWKEMAKAAPDLRLLGREEMLFVDNSRDAAKLRNGGFSSRAKVKLQTVNGDLHAIGVLEGYCPAPQVAVRLIDGQHIWWRADMCRELDEETVRILECAGVELDPEMEVGRDGE